VRLHHNVGARDGKKLDADCRIVFEVEDGRRLPTHGSRVACRRQTEGADMDQQAVLEFALDELRRVVVSLDESEMDVVTNCEPWTVRRLASHALNNQLLWAGIVTGEAIVSAEDTMAAVPHEGPLADLANDVRDRVLATWGAEGVLEETYETPFGELPGSTVILFPTIDALAHAWDLSASVSRAIEFPTQTIPTLSAVFDAVCTDDARAAGLIQAATEPPGDATDTERLMATAGRSIPR
jgi:uncharacterized protein (TIGR03086 family)